jgi:hypothetical protein
MFNDHEAIREHLIQSGFMDNYFIWTKHGVNMGIPYDVYSHHDDGCEDDIGQDDASHGDY